MNKRILNKRISIQKKIKEWNIKLKELQESCPHTDLEKKYGGNTGNYDPSNDCYWTDYNCPDCDKRWREYKE